MNSSRWHLIFAILAGVSLIMAPTSRPLFALGEGGATDEAARNKVNTDFYDKIKKKLDAGETGYYNVVMQVRKDFLVSEGEDKVLHSEFDAANPAKKHKDIAEADLLANHNAKNVNKLEVLSFVYADVPLDGIFKLAEYDYVQGIDDGELEGEALGDDAFSVGALEIDVQDVPDQPILGEVQNVIQPDMDDAREVMKADSTGYTGSGVRVAVIDTGIRQNHPDLPVGSKIIYQADCTGTSCVTASGSAVTDNNEHGTHVAGVIAAAGSSNPYRGVAYNALLINAKVGLISGKVPQAIDWAITSPRNAKVINISVGTPCGLTVGPPPTITWNAASSAADEAVEAGAIVVAPVGKNSVLVNPGCAFNVITVGMADDHQNPDRSLTTLEPSGTHNSFGPAWDGRTKPDVIAPGRGIMSTAGDTSVLYKNKSGSSFSSAMVTGAVAQLVQKNPSWNPAQIKAAIKQNAYLNSNLSPLSENQRGKGLVDVSETLSQSLSGIDYSLAYGLNVNSFVGTDKGLDSVEFRFAKETVGSNPGAIFVHSGKLKDANAAGPLIRAFDKLSVSGIKVNGVTKTLTDSKLYSGPRVDIGGSSAHAYVKYDVDGDRIILFWQIDGGKDTGGGGSLSSFALFSSGGGSKTFEAVHYMDFSIGSSATDDKTTNAFSPYEVHNVERHFPTAKNFHVRENAFGEPWVKLVAQVSPIVVNEWILNWKSNEVPTNNPAAYFSLSESINPTGTGTNILVYYKGSWTAPAVPIGPDVYVNWSTPP